MHLKTNFCKIVFLKLFINLISKGLKKLSLAFTEVNVTTSLSNR
jgi:hypothetical protein